VEQPIRFGEGYELDLRPRRLRASHVLKLERIPFEIFLLLLEHRDDPRGKPVRAIPLTNAHGADCVPRSCTDF
jgi:hypothetical protein